MSRLLLAIYLFWAGALLTIAPWWGDVWERNWFHQVPAIATLMASDSVRGVVSGIGIITAIAGVRELLAVVAALWSRLASGAPEPPPR